MKVEVDGKEIATTDTGFLIKIEDWTEDVAKVIAEQEGIALSEKHWDVINYLKDEFINNKENQPNTRNMVKDLGKIWGEKIDTKHCLIYSQETQVNKQVELVVYQKGEKWILMTDEKNLKLKGNY